MHEQNRRNIKADNNDKSSLWNIPHASGPYISILANSVSIMPHCDILYNQLQKTCMDAVEIQQ
jgi:hypothetical protein